MLRHLIIFFTLLTVSVECLGNDSVKVRYQTQNNFGGNEQFEFVVTRSQPGDVDLDKYFRTVQDALKTANANSKWESAGGIHIPVAQIDVELGNQRFSLVSNYENGSALIFSPDTAIDRRHRKAFDLIMRITAERMRVLAGATASR
ncbi:MAG: hypothetical protein IPP88_10150 [Betaproteobacteria bacterium]|nr:hypothetical protein [Betaproteobacteria bacterium]